MTALIASPFLLDLIFLWNNESLIEGLKHAEKRVSLLILPLFILGQTFRFNTMRILRYYAWITTLILSLGLVRFAIISPDLFVKYLNGKDLWEMGYAFARSLNNHAPALNMHVAFVVVINFYVLKNRPSGLKLWQTGLRILFFMSALVLLFYINTRLAILNAFLGIVLVILYENKQFFAMKTLKKGALGILIFTALGLGFVKVFPYSIEKFSTVTFAHLDKVGKLDELENPEATAYNGLVTRLSIWQSALFVAIDHPVLGVGAADGKKELNAYYKNTNQHFLAKYKFPTHNQYLDFWIKFGLLGLCVSILYVSLFLVVGWQTNQVLAVFFFILFATANGVDDFLIRFDGIVFSGLWLSVFAQSFIFKQKDTVHRRI